MHRCEKLVSLRDFALVNCDGFVMFVCLNGVIEEKSDQRMSKGMIATDIPARRSEQPSEMLLQRQWPQLGRELFTLESTQTAPSARYDPLRVEQKEMERKGNIRGLILAQFYRDEDKDSREERYCAFLFVQRGRAGEIVGNPSLIAQNGKKQELPYTGLEGYYAGSEMASEHPGLTREEILQEEAQIGLELLRTIKTQCVENYSWAKFTKLKKALECGEPGVEDLRIITLLWAEVVTRLRVRVYNNKEFERTLTEHIEQLEGLLSVAPARTQEEKEYKCILQAEYQRLKEKRNTMSEKEKEDERTCRRERERIRRERSREYDQFRSETYSMLEAGKSAYAISIKDSQLKEATIIERIKLPPTHERNEYPPSEVRLTPEQVEGYLFVAQLGNIGGDPLARSSLVSENKDERFSSVLTIW